MCNNIQIIILCESRKSIIKKLNNLNHTDVLLKALSTHSTNSRVALSSADNENR